MTTCEKEVKQNFLIIFRLLRHRELDTEVEKLFHCISALFYNFTDY